MSNNNKVAPKIGSLHYIWHFEMLTTKMCSFIVVAVYCYFIVGTLWLLYCCFVVFLSLFFDPCYSCVIVVSSLFFDVFCFLCDPFFLCCVVLVCVVVACVVVLLLFVWLCCCCCCFVVVYYCGFDVVYSCGFIVVFVENSRPCLA